MGILKRTRKRGGAFEGGGRESRKKKKNFPGIPVEGKEGICSVLELTQSKFLESWDSGKMSWI